MSAVLRGLTLLRSLPAVRGSAFTQRMNISSKPARDVIGPLETVIGLGVFSMAVLVPSGWVLAHLDDYKKRD